MEEFTLENYIETVQKSLATLAVTHMNRPHIKENPHESTFLIFEIMERSDKGEKIFKPHVSRLILPSPDDPASLSIYNKMLERLKKNDSTLYHHSKFRLPEGGLWQEGEASRANKRLEDLIKEYEANVITTNLGMTAVVYQTWKQGKLYEKWYSESRATDYFLLRNAVDQKLFVKKKNKERSDKDWLKSLLNSIAHIETGFALEDKFGNQNPQVENKSVFPGDKDDMPWFIQSRQEGKEFFFWVEQSMIHGFTNETVDNEKDFYLVHFPLILDGYWFIGFCYFFKSEEESQVDNADLFKLEEYYKCLDLLNETLGMPLKAALQEKVFQQVDLQSDTITETVLTTMLSQYFACFNFEEKTQADGDEFLYSISDYKEKISISDYDFLLPKNLKIVVSVPTWVKDHNKDKLVPEITAFMKAVNERKKAARDIKEIVEKHGSKAAAVSTMSRNLSHNDGSHCIAYWIAEIGKMLESVAAASGQSKDTNLLLANCEQLQGALLRSKELFQYLQHRMDFLAEVSTSVPCSELSMDITADILKPAFTDPLKEELTHGPYGLTKLNRSILLEYIAESEGINLHQKIEVIVANDVQSRRISIPNGIVGNHAIYSILENFLRNAAKHYVGTTIKDDDPLETAQLKCKNAISSVMTFYDILKQEGSKKLNPKKSFPITCGLSCIDYCTDLAQCHFAIETLHKYQNEVNSLPIIRIVISQPEEHKDNYLSMTIWDMRENSCNQNAVSELRKYLPESDLDDRLLSKNGELQTGGWGIKEMLISANFLGKKSADELYEIIRSRGKETEDPPLIEILCDSSSCDIPNSCCGHSNCRRTGPDKPYSGRLGWRFYLRKPKDLAIAHDLSVKKATETIFEIKELEEGEMDGEIPYRMLLVGKGQKNLYKDNAYKPCRIVESDNDGRRISDDDYLLFYETFIKDEILPPSLNKCLPMLIFTGGGLESQYTELFIEALSRYGQAVKPEGISTNDKKTAIFYHHARKKCKQFLSNGHKEKCSEFFKKYNSIYFQDISGGHSFNLRVTNTGVEGMDTKLRKHLLFELIESAMTNVIIIDERVSTWADQDWIKGIPLRKVLRYMNIMVIWVIKNAVTAKALIDQLNEIDDDKKKHFIVVHQGVLEKIESHKPGAVKELFDAVKDCRWKIVDSGRGVQKEKLKEYKQHNVRFIEISALLKMLDNFDKHALVQSLFAARNPVKKEEGGHGNG